MLKMKKSIQGFTLIEMMIALVIASVVLSGILVVFQAYNKSNIDTIKTARLDHGLKLMMRMITNDLRRAGYWANAANDIGTGQNNNPFMVTGDTDITLNAAQDCITFAYDYNGDGQLPALNTSGGDDRFGYRLMNGKIQMRPLSYTSADCTAAEDEWDDLNDPSYSYINVTGFTITPNTSAIAVSGSSSAQLQIRNYTININAQLANDTSVTRTLTEEVRVRNDKFIP